MSDLRAHRDLVSTCEAMRAGEERFRHLVESVQDYAIILLDPAGHVLTWNAGAARIKGYLAEEILGRHFSRFYRPEDVAAGVCEELLERAASEGRVEAETWRVRKDGSLFWANVVITALRDTGGALDGYAKVTRDLTERRKAEEERLRLAQVEEANRAKDELVALVSHELRTPLSSILGWTKILAQPDVDEARRRRAVETIERNALAMAQLIADVVGMSRIAGVEPVEPAPPPSPAEPDQRPSASPPQVAGLRVLVVEDDRDMRELLSEVLVEAGCQVTAASSVTEAMRCFERGPIPDVLLSDISMPGETGFDLIRRVRALPAGRGGQVPAAALTAHSRAADRQKVLAEGFELHVAKPIEPAELVGVIATLARFASR